MVHISPKAEEVFSFLGMPITNALLLTALVFVVLAVGGFIFRKRSGLMPRGFQNAVELLLETVLDMMEPIYESRKKAEKYLPLVVTIFVLILFCNWLGLLPGVGSIGLWHGEEFTPLLRAPASDLNFTLALAIIAVVMIHYFSFKELGIKIHLSKFITFESPIKFFIGILELVSEVAKIISFSFRLFGNVFAGEILLVIMAFLVPSYIPLPFMIFEFFVGFMQAFVFAMLTMVFIGIHTAKGEH